MVIVFFVVGAAIDSYLHDHSVTLHFKILGGLAGVGLTLFTARQLKNLFVRKPVKKEDFC
jgi:hypothetical protein